MFNLQHKNNITLSNITDRGYTGHEHLTAFKLINMNGRVYDPYTSQFLSPDPFIQDPTNPQNYNRYSYVLNNPLKFTDPSGYLIRYMIDGMEVTERTFFRYIGDLTGNIESVGFAGTSIFSTSLLINTLAREFSYFGIKSNNQRTFDKSQDRNRKDRRAGKRRYKLNLVERGEQIEDVMHARFRNEKFIGWVSDLYMMNLLEKGEWGENLYNRIEEELTFRPEINLSYPIRTYDEIIQFFADEHRVITSMKAPTVEKISYNATLRFENLPTAMRFDVEKGWKNWSFLGPIRHFEMDFRFSPNNILKTSFSRVQPQYGILHTIPRSHFTEINDRFYFLGAIATRFNFKVHVPVIR